MIYQAENEGLINYFLNEREDFQVGEYCELWNRTFYSAFFIVNNVQKSKDMMSKQGENRQK